MKSPSTNKSNWTFVSAPADSTLRPTIAKYTYMYLKINIFVIKVGRNLPGRAKMLVALLFGLVGATTILLDEFKDDYGASTESRSVEDLRRLGTISSIFGIKC